MTRERRSWDHVVELYPDVRSDHGCVAPQCRALIEFRCSYRYVTGRGGRISTARRAYCREHATRFAKRHRVAMPPERLT